MRRLGESVRHSDTESSEEQTVPNRPADAQSPSIHAHDTEEQLQQCKQIFARIDEVPFGTASGLALIAMTEDPDVQISNIAERVEKDRTLAARMLKLVNSAFYCFHRRIQTVEQAIILLGLRETRRLVHLANMMTLFRNTRLSTFDVSLLWKHSLATGLIARHLAEGLHDRRLIESALLAAAMHDVGKLAMIRLHPERYENVIAAVTNDHVTFADAENAEFGISHDRASGYLVKMWNLPASLGNALQYHHAQTDHSDSRVLSRVIRAANDLSHQSRAAIMDDYPALPVDDEAYLLLGLEDQHEHNQWVAEINTLLRDNADLLDIGVHDDESASQWQNQPAGTS